MQGIISGAMCLQLNTLGLRHCFDAVYGASAGAVNGAYFIADQNQGLRCYTEQCCTKRFLDLSKMIPMPPALRRRMATFLMRVEGSGTDPRDVSFSYAAPDQGPSQGDILDLAGCDYETPAMDLNYLLREIMEVDHPLDWEAVINSDLPLKVVASSLDLLRPIILDSFPNKEDLIECLMASATVPELAGPYRTVRGQRCVDAAVFEPVPISSAMEDGCTHCLVLCTRLPASNGAQGNSAKVKKAIETVVKKTLLNPEYMREAWQSSRSDVSHIHDELLSSALNKSPIESYDELGSYVLPLYPTSTRGISPVCTDPKKLLDAKQEGCMVVQRLIGDPLGLSAPIS